jgi:alkylation response protein AidB-like acyl-CoA dehydrogenase
MAETLSPLFPGLMQEAAARLAQAHPGRVPPQAQTVLRELGWPLWLSPPALGGLQGHLPGMASMVEALAQQATVLPVLEACVLAPLLLHADAERARRQLAGPWLQALEQGQAWLPMLDPCAPWGGADPLQHLTLRAHAEQGRWHVQGQVRGVSVFADGQSPVGWLAPARTDDGQGVLLALRPEQARPLATYRGIDGGWATDWTLQAELGPEQVLAEGDAVRQALDRALQAACLMSCVDMAAAATALVDRTIEYLQQRQQFDVALSSFQVLRHRVVDMHVRCRTSRGLLTRFFREATGELPARRALRLMKLAVGENARFCAESAIQCHGAMGVSEDMLAARLAQRLLHADMRYGDRLAQQHALLGAAAEAGAHDQLLAPLLHNEPA